MSLSDVILDQGMIASLYRNNLVQTAPDASKKTLGTDSGKDLGEIKEATNLDSPKEKSTALHSDTNLAAVDIADNKPELEDNAGSKNETDQNKVKYLGNNQQQLVILVKNPGEVFLPDEELNLLTKMLIACKLTLADVAILNIAQTPVQQEQIHTELHPSKIIMLGVESKDILLPMNFPEYRVQPHGPCSYLMAPGLSTMISETETSRNVKTQLWIALKQLFGL